MNVPFEGEFRFGTDGTMDTAQHFYDPEQKVPPAPPCRGRPGTQHGRRGAWTHGRMDELLADMLRDQGEE